MAQEVDVNRQNRDRRVEYRISQEEYDTMARIVGILYKNGSIKVNSVNAAAKAAAFTQLNLYLQYEAKEKAYKVYEQVLKDRKINSLRSFNYVPPPGSY